MPLKAVIFDFDGVIVNSNGFKESAFVDIFDFDDDVINSKIRAWWHEIWPISRVQKIPLLYDLIKESWYTWDLLTSSEYIHKYSTIVDNWYANTPVFPWVKSALQVLGSNYSLFVNSACPDESLLGAIDVLKLWKYFELVLWSTFWSKSENIETIIDGYWFDKDECLLVWDWVTDEYGAKTTGIRFVAIANEFNDFGSRNDIDVIYNTKDLLSIIEKL